MCKIQWIDKHGNPTPDDNVAVGFAWLPKRNVEIAGQCITMEETEHFPICEWHKLRLSEPDMYQWKFEAYPETPKGLTGS